MEAIVVRTAPEMDVGRTAPLSQTEDGRLRVSAGGEAGDALKVAGAILVPLGYAQDTTISAATALPTVPAATTVALIQAEGANIRWRDDGQDPTASVGTLLGAGCSFWYRGTFAAFKIIQVSSGGVLNVTYYQEVAE